MIFSRLSLVVPGKSDNYLNSLFFFFFFEAAPLIYFCIWYFTNETKKVTELPNFKDFSSLII